MTGDMTITDVDIECIVHRPDARLRTDDDVDALATSIGSLGLLNPIRVRRALNRDGTVDWNRFEVVAGSHRLQACDLLGWRKVPCIVSVDDDLHAELAMIDENLCRAELSPADRAQQTARRKAIYLELYPETAHGGDRKSDQVANSATRSFADETAAISGQSARTVRQDAERGEKVIPEAINLIRGTKLDTGTYLDKVKRIAPEDQVEAVKHDLMAPKPQGGVAARFQQVEVPGPIKSAERFISLADQIVAIPRSELVASGRLRATVGQRAAGVARHMDEITERLER